MTRRLLASAKAQCSIVILLACAFNLPAAVAGSVKISAGSHESGAGSAIAVPIQLTGAHGLSAIEFDVTFDPNVVTAAKFEKAALASNTMMESSVSTPGRARIALVSQAGTSGDGVLATLHLVGGSSGKTALTIENARAWALPKGHEGHTGMQHLIDVQVLSEAGSITIGGGISRVFLGSIFAALALGAIVLFFRSRRPRQAVSRPR